MHLLYKIGRKALENVDTIRDLGFILDQKFSYQAYTNSIAPLGEGSFTPPVGHLLTQFSYNFKTILLLL